jgi:hypothetical protein
MSEEGRDELKEIFNVLNEGFCQITESIFVGHVEHTRYSVQGLILNLYKLLPDEAKYDVREQIKEIQREDEEGKISRTITKLGKEYAELRTAQISLNIGRNKGMIFDAEYYERYEELELKMLANREVYNKLIEFRE